jgi:hypothetical protein
VKHPRLLDLGFEITPDWSHSKLALVMNEVVQALLLSSLLVLTAMVVVLCPWLKARPNVVNAAMRFLFAATTGHMFRPLFYLSTWSWPKQNASSLRLIATVDAQGRGA